jgi:hypothetical protein
MPKSSKYKALYSRTGIQVSHYLFRKELLALFKLKKLTCFTIIKNEANTQVISEIIDKFGNFESEKAKLIYDKNNIMKEFTLEK